jgi:hypothetical protein
LVTETVSLIRITLCVAVALAAACGGKGEQSEPAALAVPGEPSPSPARLATNLGNMPIRNPRNLYDIWIDGSPDYHTVGTIDDVKILVEDLEARSVGVFSRVAEHIYDARETGYRWLIANEALTRLSKKKGVGMLELLQAEFDALPQPTEAELEAVLANTQLVDLSPVERTRAARSLWRLERWEQRRAELVSEVRADMKFSRIRNQISQPQYASEGTMVALLDEREITRAELRVLAGYQAELARHEYWFHAKTQFEAYATEFLREREAQHLGVDASKLVELEIERMPETTEADVDAFIRENPEYGVHAEGRERARDNLRRLRQMGAEAALDERLRETGDVRFLLIEPSIPRIAVEIPAPRSHGPADAERVIYAFHSVGCDTCTRGSQLLLATLKARPGQVRVVAGDYFERNRLGSYRGALALRCAPAGERDRMLAKITFEPGKGEIGELVAVAAGLGIDAGEFERCMDRDAHLPAIAENLHMAKRLGLRRNVIGLFANGYRLGNLRDTTGVLGQIDQAFSPLTP